MGDQLFTILFQTIVLLRRWDSTSQNLGTHVSIFWDLQSQCIWILLHWRRLINRWSFLLLELYISYLNDLYHLSTYLGTCCLILGLKLDRGLLRRHCCFVSFLLSIQHHCESPFSPLLFLYYLSYNVLCLVPHCCCSCSATVASILQMSF